MTLEEQFRTGKLTHLVEIELYNADPYGRSGYRCAFCDLGVIDKNLRQARKTAEFTYGKCPQFDSMKGDIKR